MLGFPSVWNSRLLLHSQSFTRFRSTLNSNYSRSPVELSHCFSFRSRVSIHSAILSSVSVSASLCSLSFSSTTFRSSLGFTGLNKYASAPKLTEAAAFSMLGYRVSMIFFCGIECLSEQARDQDHGPTMKQAHLWQSQASFSRRTRVRIGRS